MNKLNIGSQTYLLEPLFDDSFLNVNHPLLCENGVKHAYTSFKKKVQFLASKLCETKMDPQERVAVALPKDYRQLLQSMPFFMKEAFTFH